MTAVHFAMQPGSADMNAFGNLSAFSAFIFVPALYFLPTYEAWKSKHSNFTVIALINFFLGWTLIGWVVSIAMACAKPAQVSVVSNQPSSNSAADELLKLASLKEKGLLTEEEYAKQKSKVLSS